MKKLPKQKSVSQLIKALDMVFSLYVRLKDADEKGMVRCFTSNKIYHWKDIQAGHYISRRHYALRWDERNVRPQSVSENVFNQGNSPVFGKNLQLLYGEGIIDELLLKKNNKFHLDKFILSALIQDYKKRVEELKKQKCV